MRTEKQIEASRLNGAKSGGPRSAEGKARSSRNALKSGLYAQNIVNSAEDKEAFERLQAEYTDRFQPADPEERLCLDIIIRSEWEWRRLVDTETRLWNNQMDRDLTYGDNGPGGAFQRAQTSIIRASRMIDNARRTVFLMLDRLKALQAAREDADVGPAVSPVQPAANPAGDTTEPVEPPTTSERLGFVPSLPESDAPEPEVPLGSALPHPPVPAHEPAPDRPQPLTPRPVAI
jgi:hypothetical protein